MKSSTQGLVQTWETQTKSNPTKRRRRVISEQEEGLEKKIKKEIDKLKFYLEEGDELLEYCDYSEIALTCKGTDEIQDRLNDLVSTLQELKIDRGISTQRDVRQWKKELKTTYALILEMKTKLSKVLDKRERRKGKRPRRRNSEPNSSRKSYLDAKSNNERRNFGKKR